MIITFKQKLTAIKGSIDNWDSIAAGKEGAKRSCPLCVLYGMCSRGCPIYMKTGEEHCRGTPYRDYIKAKENQQEYPNNPDYISTAACAAKDFRDWLKDLYIEVSEKGENKETLAEAIKKSPGGVTWLPPEDTAKELKRERDESARELIKQHDRLFSLETKVMGLEAKVTNHEERLGNRNRIEKKLWLKIEALEKRLNKLEKERSDLKETYRIIKRALG